MKWWNGLWLNESFASFMGTLATAAATEFKNAWQNFYSVATAQTSQSKVDDPLLRSMLWQSLWDGVRDGKLPLNEFIKTALANASGEKDYTLLGNVLDMISWSKRYLDAMPPPRAAYTREATQAIEDQAWAGVQARPSGWRRSRTCRQRCRSQRCAWRWTARTQSNRVP